MLFYACTSHWKRGPVVCRNGLVGRMDAIDAEVLATLETDILRPSVVERAIRLALDALKPERQQKAHATLARDAERARVECDRLADAIQRGGPMDVLIDRLRAAQTRRVELERQLAARQSPGLRSVETWRDACGRSWQTGAGSSHATSRRGATCYARCSSARCGSHRSSTHVAGPMRLRERLHCTDLWRA